MRGPKKKKKKKTSMAGPGRTTLMRRTAERVHRTEKRFSFGECLRRHSGRRPTVRPNQSNPSSRSAFGISR